MLSFKPVFEPAGVGLGVGEGVGGGGVGLELLDDHEEHPEP